MHTSALEFGRRFLDSYALDRRLTIAEIGASDVNGSLRQLAGEGHEYIGLDLEPGPGVDRVIDDPYRIPVEDGVLDMCLASSCLEHVEFFWLLFEEMLRVLKPDGLVYLNVPSSGPFHRYPVDCWRFYPDSGVALERWGRRQGFECLLLESFVDDGDADGFRDFVCVFLKDRSHVARFPRRILDDFDRFTNGLRDDQRDFANPSDIAEPTELTDAFKETVKEELKRLWRESKKTQ
ncbi:MAG: class I SAM-dependent methyltransferase [Parasphingopyxis sp.]|nr:class I SAM-dependent methyltransferase [Sphingomonadales bacterium]